MAKRSFEIKQLIINSPYEEPLTYWSYEREVRMFERKDGRRPAGYIVATPGSKVFDDPGVFVELSQVNRIRPRVQAWREAGYPRSTWNRSARSFDSKRWSSRRHGTSMTR